MPGTVQALKTFARAQSGAVTVEYLPFVAGIIGLGILVVTSVGNGTGTASQTVSDTLKNAEVNTPVFAAAGPNANTNNGPIGGDPLPTQPEGVSGGEGGSNGSGSNSGGSNSGGSNSGGSNSGGSNGGGSNGGGSDAGSSGVSGGDNGTSPSTGSGNPGNDKDVGKAGESPSDQNDFGGGSVGNSDSSGTSGNAPGNSGGAAGGGSQSASDDSDDDSSDDATGVHADFTFPTMNVGINAGDIVVSDWISFSELGKDKVDFSISGDGNATAQAHNGKQRSEGKIKGGTKITVETPPPGETYTVVLQLGDQVGTFTVTRAAQP